MDLRSVLGYSNNSPFANEPYLDINTPEGMIDMSNTPHDIIGMDNKGNVKRMKANSQNPYKFEGDVVREIPLNKNPYMQQGGMNQQLLSYLFDDNDEEEQQMAVEPEMEDPEKDPALAKNERILIQKQADELALQQATMPDQWENPYRREENFGFEDELSLGDETYTEQLSSGKWGSQNVGQQGRQIVGEITQALGYTPQFNSIFRDKQQQDKLVQQGIGAKNSFHLTGDAVDMKPTDWNNLPQEKKQYFRANYDVIYHNNHYHIEPKG